MIDLTEARKLEEQLRSDDARECDLVERAPGCYGCAARVDHIAIADTIRDLCAEVERLAGLVSVSPDDIASVADENDRLLKAFDELIKKLRAGQEVRSAMCTWCGQHWPMLDGEPIEVFRKYTNEHANQCPANGTRAERDAALAKVAALEHRVSEGNDHLSIASRRMVDTVMGERDALRDKVRSLTGELEAARAIDAASQRTIASGNEAFQALRKQWQGDVMKVEAELDSALARVKELEAVFDSIADQLETSGSFTRLAFQIRALLEKLATR